MPAQMLCPGCSPTLLAPFLFSVLGSFSLT